MSSSILLSSLNDAGETDAEVNPFPLVCTLPLFSSELGGLTITLAGPFDSDVL